MAIGQQSISQEIIYILLSNTLFIIFCIISFADVKDVLRDFTEMHLPFPKGIANLANAILWAQSQALTMDSFVSNPLDNVHAKIM
jgi:hypothetical protein